MSVAHPWQVTPSELIKQAIELLHRGTETDRQIAFLLLDVGVETLFKTFLLLPESVTKVETKYSKRAEGAAGNFHALVESVKEAGNTKLVGINLDQVKYYHSIRNKLYHQGDGVVPSKANSDDYAFIAVELLDRLLSVDLRPLLLKDQQRQELSQRREILLEQKLGELKEEVNERIRKIRAFIIRLLEDRESAFVKKSFADDMEEFIGKMSQPDARRWGSGIRRLLRDGLFILDDDDIPVECYKWEYSDRVLDFLYEIMAEKSPAGPYPKELIELLEYHNLSCPEYTLAEIITAEDFTEFLLLITSLMDDFPQVTTVESYRCVQEFLNWEIDMTLADSEFNENLEIAVEVGKQILESLNVSMTIIEMSTVFFKKTE